MYDRFILLNKASVFLSLQKRLKSIHRLLKGNPQSRKLMEFPNCD